MEIYLVLVVVLFALAASDLVVGVSNDAVNFLNSAIGAKVTSRMIILLVASAGILLGALFSSGMMEVARKGIFHPDLFSFAEVMVIFLAVMLTDVILLDLFNTYGMPTSTTVSIVFELLGAAVVVALIKINTLGLEYSAIFDYINSQKAILIISGIFLSIVVAFAVGAMAQFISRLIFTFDYEKKIRTLGPVWGGLSLAIMTYFLLIKGFKGASFTSLEMIEAVKSSTTLLLVLSFGFWTVLLKGIQLLWNINILKVIVLSGTFSLAMAFASNDLVNFIGVPMAGFESFKSWSISDQLPEQFMMLTLGETVSTSTLILATAGLIMVITLWFSKKARTVTATEVNLSRQHTGTERFKPNFISRITVNLFLHLNEFLKKMLPVRLLDWMDNRLKQTQKPANGAAFDLVRASVNLTIASMLIAMATSYKLPLSTTYVSFMVAMGTSLADRAWGVESAHHRVAGVINVIGGWFMTALIAFIAAGLFALVLSIFGFGGVLALILMLLLIMRGSFKIHNKNLTAGGFGKAGSGALG